LQQGDSTPAHPSGASILRAGGKGGKGGKGGEGGKGGKGGRGRRGRRGRRAGGDGGMGKLDWAVPPSWIQLCSITSWRVEMRIAGVILIVFGIVALLVRGIGYTREHKVLDLGPLQASTEEHKTIPLSPIVGFASLAGGIALLVAGTKARA
jgi:hypothetical protein